MTEVQVLYMKQLSPDDQDAVVEFINHELADDKNWFSTIPELYGNDPFSWTTPQLEEYIKSNYSSLVVLDGIVRDWSPR